MRKSNEEAFRPWCRRYPPVRQFLSLVELTAAQPAVMHHSAYQIPRGSLRSDTIPPPALLTTRARSALTNTTSAISKFARRPCLVGSESGEHLTCNGRPSRTSVRFGVQQQSSMRFPDGSVKAPEIFAVASIPYRCLSIWPL